MNSATPQQAADPTTAANSPPDWDKLERDVHCPLCQYNLRGISEPRCPECGYRFDWSELLDPSNNHPYLFEQARHSYVKSFLKTLLRNGQPEKFWKTLRPNMHVNGQRLFVYWLICAVLASLPAIWVISFPAIRAVWPLSSTPRAITTTRTWTTGSRTFTRTFVIPRASWAQTNQGILNRNRQMVFLVCFGMALYPLLSIGALMLFHESMHRAKVLPRHVIRVGIYSADAIVWTGLWIVMALFFQTLNSGNGTAIALLEVGAVQTIIFTTFRISAAYSHYMRFPDPVATALLSQFIVFLTLAVLWIPLLSEMIRSW